jgi:hypothetical protein
MAFGLVAAYVVVAVENSSKLSSRLLTTGKVFGSSRADDDFQTAFLRRYPHCHPIAQKGAW